MRLSKKTKITKEERLYIKLAAYSALIEFDEHILPVLSDFNQIINSSVYILSMQIISQKLGYKDNCFSEAGKGLAIYVSDSRHYIILYDEQLPSPDIRWTIARLLYLVWSEKLKEHPDRFHYMDNIEDIDKCNIFAYYFTCPDIILEECGINNASEIIKYCEIPFLCANIKNKFLCTAATSKALQPIEEILKKMFASDIERIKQIKKM